MKLQVLTSSPLFKLTIFATLALTLTLTQANHTILPGSLSDHRVLLLSLSWCAAVSLAAYLATRPRPVLLLDYSCHLPDPDRRCSLEVCEYFGLRSRRFSKTSEDFMRAIYSKSGLGDETYGPPLVFQPDYEAKHACAVQEAREGLFASVEAVLAKAAVDASRITHLVVACSMYSPAPSLASVVVGRFGLSEDVKCYNLSGMGCSAGTLSVDLASRMLRSGVGYVLIVVTESLSLNWYFGDDRHMLVTNCIFRVGTAAAIVTNDPAARPRAKMELIRTLRTHHGSDDAFYNAAIQKEDEHGSVGVSLTQDLVRVAGLALKKHISTLAPRVLPVSELLRYVYNVVKSYAAGDKKTEHVPDFTTAFEHMCIHAGGKAVIGAVGRIMKFSAEVVEPARMCLHRFGNTSSSLVFYELAYFEAKGRIKEGDRVWMLAFGTGFKACSVVWRALKDSWMDADNPWIGCIHRYPVKL
ncbi:putative 3-ketoacyl-CoA synthase 17 [Iris pallida]|uniref:3-ketoacyl-CoA synthase n=1 Tax=Iris pallida TaxID=29817 RepID=A0AAX6EG84_IRIPA|nr:putative 3-ketoacyl-CoA synthase 17 [Iris pallida]